MTVDAIPLRKVPRLSAQVGPQYFLLAAVFALAAALAGISLLWTAAVLAHPGEVNYGEAVIHDQAGRLLRGEPLYQPLYTAPYTVTAYTPLYYWIAAALQLIFGPGFAPGRLVSLFAGIASAALVAYLAFRYSRHPALAALAALLFLGLNAPWDIGPPWWSYYKEDTLGVFLSFASIALLAGGSTTRRLLLAGTLAGLAILTKQTFLAASAAGVVWLWSHDRKGALTFGATSFLVALVPSIALEVTTHAYFANTIFANANPSSLAVLQLGITVLFLTFVGPVFICLLHFRSVGRAAALRDERLLITYWLFSAVPLLGLVKVGSNYNYWLEFAGPSAALTAVAIGARLTRTRVKPEPSRAVLPLTFLALHLAAMLGWFAWSSPPHAIAEWTALATGRSRPHDLNALVERVRSEPREVLGRSFDVIALAGRPNLFEPDIYGIFYVQGLWDPAPIVQRIRTGQVGLLVLDAPIDDHAHWGPRPIAWWPEPVLTALRETMILESRLAGRWVYAPRVT